MNRKATKSLQFKFNVTAVKDASGECTIEGYANTSTKDRVGDVVLPEAFEKSLETYRKNPVILLNHDWNDVIGRCFHQEITDKGLFIRAKISNTRNDIKTLINEGCYSTFSIGYNEVDADYDESTKTKYIKELELLEISVVSVPANTEAMFTQITEKTDTDETAKKGEEEKTAKKAGSLKAFISDVKNVVGKGFDDEALFAVIDYFNSEEETMETKELIKLLQAKTLPEATPTQDQAKADAPKPEDAPQAQGHDDFMKALAAKLDAVAQALAQVMEKLDQMEKEDAAEDSAEEPQDKPSEDAPADESKQDPSKEDAPQDASAEEMDKEEDDKEKDLSISDVDKTIADLAAQIDALDEEVNG